jgi:hypothetical protein
MGLAWLSKQPSFFLNSLFGFMFFVVMNSVAVGAQRDALLYLLQCFIEGSILYQLV